MTQYVYETTIFEIRRQAMQDAMNKSAESGGFGGGLLDRATAILEWYLQDLPKTTDMKDSKV